MAEKKRKICQICGSQYVPTSNVQKYCPDCRQRMNSDGGIKEAYLSYKQKQKPGEVVTYNLNDKVETPEDMMAKPETPESPAIREGYLQLQKAIDMPDGLAVVEEHAEILRRYYRGELVDKNEFMARIREKFDEF